MLGCYRPDALAPARAALYYRSGGETGYLSLTPHHITQSRSHEREQPVWYFSHPLDWQALEACLT